MCSMLQVAIVLCKGISDMLVQGLLSCINIAFGERLPDGNMVEGMKVTMECRGQRWVGPVDSLWLVS